MKETKMIRQFNLQTGVWEMVPAPMMALGNTLDNSAEQIDARRRERDGWATAHWDGR